MWWNTHGFAVFEERPTATLQNSENTRLATMNDLSGHEVHRTVQVHTERPIRVYR
jgi:hypothetical protein